MIVVEVDLRYQGINRNIGNHFHLLIRGSMAVKYVFSEQCPNRRHGTNPFVLCLLLHHVSNLTYAKYFNLRIQRSVLELALL